MAKWEQKNPDLYAELSAAAKRKGVTEKTIWDAVAADLAEEDRRLRTAL
ncbi:MAG: hypothetical protein HYZ63_02210 [Candidatus Andersenbacteria bacterium]|nr:hypothetical protein [Candidatus Andersenbacteria bacterium]